MQMQMDTCCFRNNRIGRRDNISPEMAGKVTEVLDEEGQLVKGRRPASSPWTTACLRRSVKVAQRGVDLAHQSPVNGSEPLSLSRRRSTMPH